MNNDELKFFVDRLYDRMGGREAAFAVFNKEFSAMTALWKQDVNVIGRILRSHLYVEFYITEYLQSVNPNIGFLGEARLNFSQKINLLKSDDDTIKMIIGGIRHLNKIRNRLAHNLSSTVTEDDAKFFLSQNMFRMMLDASGKNQAVMMPIDVLEEFSQFASLILHGTYSSSGKLLANAMRDFGK